jgi:hypothetical protein
MGVKNLFLHLGLGKCGSSSIQSAFSLSPEHVDKDGDPLRYVALGQEQVLGPRLVKERAQRNAHAYIASVAPAGLVRRSECSRQRAARFLQAQSGASLVLSNEGWSPAFAYPGFCEAIEELIQQCSPRKTTAIVVVRPPVEWVNSAWWQWGAWQPEPDFERWFQSALPSLVWQTQLDTVKRRFPEMDVRVLPLKSTLLADVSVLCGLEATALASPDGAANQSLPAVVLRLYQAFPDLRPGPHASGMDFSVLKALADPAVVFQRAPWVINQKQIRQILTQTQPSVGALMEAMSQADATAVRNDPRWWSAEAYQDRNSEDPLQGHCPDLAAYASVITAAYRRLHLQSLDAAPLQ